MSTENPVLRPFVGLGEFEALLDRVRLRLVDASLEPVLLEPGATTRVPVQELTHLGLALQFDWRPEDIAGAAQAARVPTEQLQLWILAEDSFLKERTALTTPLRLMDLPEFLPICSRGDARPEALSNRFSGFEIHVAVVLAEPMAEVLAFRPHRKGTILAAASFPVRAERNSGGLDPRPLDAQVRKDHGDLPVATVMLVDIDGELLREEDLSQAVTVYVHEGLYGALQGKGPERAAVLQQLALGAWSQIIDAMHAEMTDDFVWDGNSGAAMRLLLRAVRVVKPKMRPAELEDLVRAHPRRLNALMSGVGAQANLLLRLIGDDETGDAA